MAEGLKEKMYLFNFHKLTDEKWPSKLLSFLLPKYYIRDSWKKGIFQKVLSENALKISSNSEYFAPQSFTFSWEKFCLNAASWLRC